MGVNNRNTMGGGGGGAFTPRTDDQLDVVPAAADAAVAVGAGCIAAASVSPFLMCVDRAVTAAAAGQTSSVWRGVVDNVSEFVRKPGAALRQPALWMVCGVYAGTYAAANLSDVVGERAHAYVNSKAAGKFTATTGANMLGGIAKDAAFARMFGAPVTNGAALVVPFASYGLFAARDCLTIGGAFFLPSALSNALVASGTSKDESAAAAVAQLVSPPLAQVVCTPMHLLALNMVNAPVATMAQRTAALKVSTPAALLARSLRMLPAYGVGGLLNSALTKKGREMALSYGHSGAFDELLEGTDDDTFVDYAAVEDLEGMFGDDRGENILHTFSRALYGDLHPQALASDVDFDEALWKFRWERLIQSAVSHQLAEMGGDTVGGCVVVGGDADVDADVDAFVDRADTARNGKLSVAELETLLQREKANGVGWAAAALSWKDESVQHRASIWRSSLAPPVSASLTARGVAKGLMKAADGDGDGFISSADIKRLLHKRVKEGEEVAGKKARLRRSSSKKDVTNLAGAGG